MNEQEFVTIAEAVRLTGLSRNTILRRIKAGELEARPKHPHHKKGGPVLLLRAQVEALRPSPQP